MWWWKKMKGRSRGIQPTRLSTRAQLLQLQMENEHLKAQLESGVKKEREERINEIFSKAQQAEVCFLVDCTASMARYIEEVKSKVMDIVNDVRKSYKQLDLRMAFIGYRDFGDENRLSILHLTKDIHAFRTFVSLQKATGGDDEAEDVFGGLDAVLQLEWEAPTRVLIQVADAPGHGKRFHPEGRRLWDQKDHALSKDGKDRHGLSAEALIPQIFKADLSYHFFHVNRTNTEKMIEEFNKICRPSGFAIVEVDLEGAPDSLKKSAVMTVTGCIAATAHILSREMPTVTTIADSVTDSHRFEKKIPNWKNIRQRTAFATWFQPPASVADVREGMELEKKSGIIQIKVAPLPFSEGHMRQAYHAACMRGVAASHGKLVAKTSRSHRINTVTAYEDQMEIQCVSQFLAEEFNTVLQKEKPGSPQVQFLQVYTVQAEGNAPYYANLEPFVEGNFEKFNNNAGYVSASHDALQAFSHWTYHATNGYLMVVDLQVNAIILLRLTSTVRSNV
eukprot:evm.model.scf_761.1 EVM.evm.TU.scf_761.1   scf_761:19146-21246(+)